MDGEQMKAKQRSKRKHGALEIAVGTVLAFLLTGLLPISAQAQDKGFDKVAWLRDYNTLKTALERRYSNLG